MSFREPTVDERDITLWFMQDRLTPEECDRQLAAMREAGIGTIICRTFTGLDTPYLSEEYLRVMAGVVATAKRLGLKLWFQAAWMTRELAELPDEFRSQGMMPDGAGGHRLTPRHGAIDMLNPDAMRWYAEHAYRFWSRDFGADMGDTIVGIWTDEPMLYANQPPWSPGLFARYRSDWGEDLEPRLGELVGDPGEANFSLRHRYWRTVRSLLDEAYGRLLGGWCRENNLLFTGHLMGEETFGQSINFAAGCMPAYRHFGIPGIDHLTGDLTWLPGHHCMATDTPFLLTPLQCAAVAEQYDKGSALAEVYAVTPNSIDFAMMQRIGDYFQVLGINRRVLHSFSYSLRGLRKRLWPPALSDQQPWWPEYVRVNDRFARLGTQLRRGRHAAEILVIHPLESAYGVHDASRHANSARACGTDPENRLESDLIAVCQALLDGRRQFHLGDEGHLADDGRVAGGQLHLKAARYRRVVLPSCVTLRGSTAALLQAFQRAGGQVVRCGGAPTRRDGVEDADFARWVDGLPACTPGELAAQFPEPLDIGVTGRAWATIRDDGDERLVFLHNPSDTDPARLSIPDGWRQLDCESGTERSPCREHDLAPNGSLLLCRDAASTSTPPPSPARSILAHAGPWQLARDDANVLVLDSCELIRGDGRRWRDMPVYAIEALLKNDEPYEGPIELVFAVRCAEAVRARALIVEEAAQWRVDLDGEPLDSRPVGHWRDHRFDRIALDRVLAAGEHRIRLRRDYSAPPSLWGGGLAAQMKRRGGVECENIYLLGDFIVRGQTGTKSDPYRCRRLAGPLELAGEPGRGDGRVVDDGYPFFVGQLDHRCAVELPELDARARYLLEVPGARANGLRIRVNGTALPTLLWAPWRVDVTGQLHRGRNEITIGLVTSLRNAIGPHHRPIGEVLQNWGPMSWDGGFSPETGKGFPRWYEHTQEDTAAFTRDHLPVDYALPEGVRILRQGG